MSDTTEPVASGRAGAAETRRLRLIARVPPPLIYVAAFLVGWAFQQVLRWPVAPDDFRVRIAGAVLLVFGVLLGPVNAIMFLSRGTTLNPTRSPERFFTGGVYRITRNPMYIGLLLIYAGVAVLHWQLWSLLLIVVPFLAVDRIFIPLEEEKMKERFGNAYADYCARVRRWIGTRR